MGRVSNRSKIIYLSITLIFTIGLILAFLDYIGVIDMGKMAGTYYKREVPAVLDAKDDEPSLVDKEEFEKEKQKFTERIEDIDKREARIVEGEKLLASEKEKLEEIRKGLELEKKKLENEKKRYSGYKKNVVVLARKVESIKPEEAVEIMVKWEDALIIDVLRQIDSNAEEAGKMSITSYLISLMPRDKAGRIMYLMTQL